MSKVSCKLRFRLVDTSAELSAVTEIFASKKLCSILGSNASQDKANIITSIDEAARIVPELLEGEFQKAMNFLHAED